MGPPQKHGVRHQAPGTVTNTGAGRLPPTALTIHEHQGEPRVRDIDLAVSLGMAQPLNIRSTIKANLSELQGLGSIHAESENSEGRVGRPSVVYLLNEAQAVLLTFLAKTEKAKLVRAEVIRVFVDWRNGRLDKPRARVGS